ncbi:MAG: hypothetical protein A2297_00395 [Elusimicrobia bacterium RIFOXYB2_FULL_48_7]|nr:MAG: hypothetical protein A2297_00395 [Elusimicrobia bacterium RIFOXYB2_FULL_48_7]
MSKYSVMILFLLTLTGTSFGDDNSIIVSSEAMSTDQTLNISTMAPVVLKHEYDKEIQGLLEDLKNNKINANIAIYYIEKTIIKEAPQDEYLTHLLQALKDNLKKGKKEGKIRRIENNLVEIDKGSIHKVRERDIYKVYDRTTGVYKGKLEVQAMADAVSIGKTYNSNILSMNKDDTIKYYGQRKVFGLGVVLGGSSLNTNQNKVYDFENSANLSGGGLLWEWTFPNGWSIQWLLGEYSFKSFQLEYSHYDRVFQEVNKQYEIKFDTPIVLKKNLTS